MCFYQLGAKTNRRRELDILCQQHSLPVRNLENQPKLLVNIIARIFCISIMPKVIIFGSHAINPDSREIICYHLLWNLNIHQNHLEAWQTTDCWTPSESLMQAVSHSWHGFCLPGDATSQNFLRLFINLLRFLMVIFMSVFSGWVKHNCNKKLNLSHGPMVLRISVVK